MLLKIKIRDSIIFCWKMVPEVRSAAPYSSGWETNLWSSVVTDYIGL